MTDMNKTPDQRALEAVCSPGFDPTDPLTQPAVNAFLAPFTDTDPVTGLMTVDTRESCLDPWTGPTDEHGQWVYHPTARRIMGSTDNPADLSDRDVLTLVLASSCTGTHLPGEWELYVRQQAERSVAYLAASNAQARKRNASSERQARARDQYRLPAPPQGYRNAPLKHRLKMRVTASLKSAEERRDRRRKEHGIVVVPHRSAFKAMTVPEVQQLRQTQEELILKNATALQTLEGLLGGPEVDHVGFLYKYGRPPRLDNASLRLTSRWARGTL